MLLKLALFFTIIFQFFAASIAVKLTKVTKYNLSWILISVGFVFMAIRRLIEFLPYVTNFQPNYFSKIYIWLGALTSFLFVGGVILIRKIFIHMKKVELETREQEKKILSAMIQAEEKERKRFAKELHDGLGPLLSSVKMSVSSLSQIEHAPNETEILNNTNLLIDEAIKSIKEISNNLSPHVLTNFGLARALNNFIHKLNLTKKVNIELNTNISDTRYSMNIETVIYRVTCELINNTLKHANAKNINIEINQINEILYVKYADDGIGFDIEQILKDSEDIGMGYSNIFSRIDSLKGSITLKSEKTIGSLAIIKIPLNHEK